MPRLTAAALLAFALVPLASADVIYTYTGNPFTTVYDGSPGVYGTPTEVTVTLDIADPFPTQNPDPGQFGVPCGSVGVGVYSWPPYSAFVSGSISDGVRTFIPDIVYIGGCGTSIYAWEIAGGYYLYAPSSSDRAISTSDLPPVLAIGPGDFTTYVQAIYNSAGQQIGADGFQASGLADGVWTAVVTPEVNTGALALISGSLLLFGYWCRRHR